MDRDFYLIHCVDRAREAGWEFKLHAGKVRAVPPPAIREQYGLRDIGYFAGDDLWQAVSYVDGFRDALQMVSIHKSMGDGE